MRLKEAFGTGGEEEHPCSLARFFTYCYVRRVTEWSQLLSLLGAIRLKASYTNGTHYQLPLT